MPQSSRNRIIVDALQAPIKPLPVLSRLAREPAPHGILLALNWWMWNFLMLSLLGVFSGQWASVPAAGYAALLALLALSSFVATVLESLILHLLFLLSGGSGGFSRSVQIGALLAPLHALSVLPLILRLRWATAALATYFFLLLVLATERLHQGVAWRGRIVWSLVAALWIPRVWHAAGPVPAARGAKGHSEAPSPRIRAHDPALGWPREYLEACCAALQCTKDQVRCSVASLSLCASEKKACHECDSFIPACKARYAKADATQKALRIPDRCTAMARGYLESHIDPAEHFCGLAAKK